MTNEVSESGGHRGLILGLVALLLASAVAGVILRQRSNA